ncbi:MAG: polyprenyl diphosphate synthase [Dehalococcoidales bacterium]|nr:polyprenyl diphosphate synthase [Dehalococcoidales bacterium]
MNGKFHVGMIPDGNRRWAKERGLKPWEGHKVGSEKAELFIEWCIDHPEIDEITAYGLSEENFKRPTEELQQLYAIYVEELTRLLNNKKIHDGKVRVNIVSTDPHPLPGKLKGLMDRLKNETKSYNLKLLNMLIGYTGQSEILQAVSTPGNRIKNLFFGLKESDLERGLQVKNPCDFIIRTGTEEKKREAKSGFLLWQSAYAEYYHINKYFPELTDTDLNESWEYFKGTRRRKGL